jgi:hypothetical protein
MKGEFNQTAVLGWWHLLNVEHRQHLVKGFFESFKTLKG